MEFHVALLQLLPGGTVQENLETGLNACRHPKKYGILLDEQIRPPFLRPDRREP